MSHTGAFICLGYLSGSVLYARVFAGLFKKKDIFELSPDQNPGAANAFQYGGFWCGLLTLIFDFVKGFVPVFLFMHIGPGGETPPFLAALVIAAPVLGHILPLFFRFRGGKGIAVTFGVLAGLYPEAKPVLILIFFFVFFSLVLKISPNYYRTIFAYVFTLVTMLLRLQGSAASLAFLLIAGAVLVRLLSSREKRDRLEVKLLGRSHSHLRNGRRT